MTQTNDFKLQIEKNIQIRNIGWIEIDNLIDEKTFENDQYIQDFKNFIRRGYKMKDQKEILIQDLGDKVELKKFKEFNVYRRNKIYGSPLYFAPYFTRSSGEIEGITHLSKILGIISAKPSEIPSFVDDLKIFSDSKKNLVNKWIKGIGLDKEKETFTYFFLDDSIVLNNPLLKDGTNKKGRGKNWIAAMIPPNRCVTFEEFVKRMNSSL